MEKSAVSVFAVLIVLPAPGPSPWSGHTDWQGRVYSVRAGDIYPSIYEVCGLGYVDGLEGANCRHRRFPWVEGVSERTYTDDQLAYIDDGLGCEYDGKKYTAYEATQMQRRVERQIRSQKRLKNAYKAAGLTDDATAANIRLRRLNAKYKAFSKAAGLPEQPERLKVLYSDAKSEAAAQALKAQRDAEAALKNDGNTAILNARITSGEISTQIRPQVQARHIEGTAEFERYRAQRLAKGQTPQSVMTITAQEAQKFVERYTGTGTIAIKTRKDGSLEIKEYTNVDRVIGQYYESDAFHDTKRIMIIYSKKGVHIVPTVPQEG